MNNNYKYLQNEFSSPENVMSASKNLFVKQESEMTLWWLTVCCDVQGEAAAPYRGGRCRGRHCGSGGKGGLVPKWGGGVRIIPTQAPFSEATELHPTHTWRHDAIDGSGEVISSYDDVCINHGHVMINHDDVIVNLDQLSGVTVM